MVVGRRRSGWLALGLTLTLLPGCLSRAVTPAVAEAVTPVGPVSTSPIYAHAIKKAVDDGLKVWLDADLASRWLEGSKSFQAGVNRVGQLSRLRGVVGVKVADEFGYNDGFTGRAGAMRGFARQTAAALHRAAPGKLILADILVPELGCAPGISGPAAGPAAACRSEFEAKYPALTLDEIGRLLRTGAFDAVNLSTGLLSGPEYASWGITLAQAQEAAWREVQRRGWADLVTLDSRKALAFPGRYPYSAERAQLDLHAYVGVPAAEGAHAVDIWAWHRLYESRIVRLMNPGLRPNPLWDGLVASKKEGIRLFTQFSPTSVEKSVRVDLKVISHAFTGVFMAAGTG